MRRGMDPSIVLTTLITSIQNQYLGPGKCLPKDELISIFLSVATDEYRPVLSIEQKLQGEGLTLEYLETSMMEE